MEGTYAVDICLVAPNMLRVRAIENRHRERAALDTETPNLIENLLEVCLCAIAACRGTACWSQDAERLEALLPARLRIVMRSPYRIVPDVRLSPGVSLKIVLEYRRRIRQRNSFIRSVFAHDGRLYDHPQFVNLRRTAIAIGIRHQHRPEYPVIVLHDHHITQCIFDLIHEQAVWVVRDGRRCSKNIPHLDGMVKLRRIEYLAPCWQPV